MKFLNFLRFTFNVIVLAITFWLPISKFALDIEDKTLFSTYENTKIIWIDYDTQYKLIKQLNVYFTSPF